MASGSGLHCLISLPALAGVFSRSFHSARSHLSPTGAFPSAAWQRRDWLIIAGLTLLALVLRLYRLEHRSLWTDEFHTLAALQMPLPDLVRNRIAAGHLPTYFILMKLWTQAAGLSDWALRFPSAVTGALLVPAAAFMARPFASRGCVLALAGVACLNGAALWAGQEARMYALLTVTATLCHGFYLRTLRAPGKAANWIGYYAMLLISVSLQPVMLLWYAAHLAFSFLECRRHPAHARVALTVAAALALALLPALLLFGGAQRKFTGLHFDPAGPWMLVTRFTTVAFGEDNDLPGFAYAARAALVGAAVAGGVMEWRRKRRLTDAGSQPEAADGPPPPEMRLERPLVVFSFVAALVPAVLLWAGECFLPNVLGPWRYQVPSLIPIWVLLLWVITGIRPRPWRRAAGAAAALLLAAGAIAHWQDAGTGLREAGQYLAARVRPGDLVAHPRSPTLALGLRRYGVPEQVELIPIPDVSNEQELVRALGELEGRDRLWLVMYRLRERERRELLESFGRLRDRLTEVPEETFRFGQSEVRLFVAQ